MARPVPVLFLLPALPVGGAERQIAALVRGLDPARFRPLVATQHGRGPVAEDLEAAGHPVRVLSDARRFDPSFLARVATLVRSEGVRLVLAHGFSTGVAARVGGLLGGAPVRILAEHSTGERDMSPARHRVNRLLAPLTDTWVALAEGQLPYLVEEKGIPRDRIRIIPNGIDPAPFGPDPSGRPGARERIRAELGLPADAPVAGILAVLRPEKDHRTFLLAARFVLDELPEAHFLVVGDGPLRGDLEHELTALDLVGRVVFAGRRADIPDVLTAFDVSVLSSTDVETFPLAFLEAMATGLPLVGTRVGGLPDLVHDGRNGRLVRPRDPRGLADAMRGLLADADLRRRLGAESRRLVEERFHVDRMIRAYEDLFAERLTRRGVAVPPRPGGDA
jgi:glycosyltransferase involved in cell wall biosynthesis